MRTISDLVALTPPLVVCLVFLVAVAAFLRHEMRGRKRGADGGTPDESAVDSGLRRLSGNSEKQSGFEAEAVGKQAASAAEKDDAHTNRVD